MAPVEKTGKFSGQEKKERRAAAKKRKSGAGRQRIKDEDRRRKTLHYGRFKFTVTNRPSTLVAINLKMNYSGGGKALDKRKTKTAPKEERNAAAKYKGRINLPSLYAHYPWWA